MHIIIILLIVGSLLFSHICSDIYRPFFTFPLSAFFSPHFFIGLLCSFFYRTCPICYRLFSRFQYFIGLRHNFVISNFFLCHPPSYFSSIFLLHISRSYFAFIFLFPISLSYFNTFILQTVHHSPLL